MSKNSSRTDPPPSEQDVQVGGERGGRDVHGFPTESVAEPSGCLPKDDTAKDVNRLISAAIYQQTAGGAASGAGAAPTNVHVHVRFKHTAVS